MIHEPIRPLTAREKQVAVRIARGLSYTEIAAELDISPHTVRAQIRTMAMKFVLDPDDQDLPPRHVILLYVMQKRWAADLAKRRGRDARRTA